MCTSIVYNGKKTLVGWNLDILDMKYRVSPSRHNVLIEIFDEKEGWLPLFGVNGRGDFVGMPTCWPYDERSDPKPQTIENILMFDINIMLEKVTMSEAKQLAESGNISSVPGVTFQAQISDRDGNVMQVVPGQGTRYIPKPGYSIMTNFSPYKGDSEKHPWMGKDRYDTAEDMVIRAGDTLDTDGMFEILKAVSQTVCPTVVSMVYDSTMNTVTWCENREYYRKSCKHLD